MSKFDNPVIRECIENVASYITQGKEAIAVRNASAFADLYKVPREELLRRARIMSGRETPASYQIQISDTHRQLIVKALRALDHRVILGHTTANEWVLLIDMLDNLPQEEAEAPGVLHGFTL